jgi:hypothetical protein
MLSPQALVKGIVSRVLPGPTQDGPEQERTFRLDRYGAIYVQGEVLKQHALADEGSYFVANNGQTGILVGTQTAFTAGSPSCIFANNDSPSNPTAKRLYLDYVELLVTTAGAGTSSGPKFMALVLDQGNRAGSPVGGTDFTSRIVSPNQDNPLRSSIAQVIFGALTATTATGGARTVVGQRMVRLPVSASALDTPGDIVRLEFGAPEQMSSVVIGSTALLQANAIQACLKLPPVIVGPGQSCLIYLWQAVSNTTATTYAPEIGWWER